MKKLLSKLRRKPASEQSGRITTDTIAEHRERILAGGRRFKYPVQYARHKLVFNAIIISVAALLLLLVVGWWQLYSAQNTSNFMYRVTRVLPLPVATIDGYPVRYSDYLMKYRSSMHYLVEKEQLDTSSEDGMRQSDFVKSQAIDDAIADAFAMKIADDRNITVTDAELEAFLLQQRNANDGEVSEATYNAVVLDYYDWSPEEYRLAMSHKLLRQKMSYLIDVAAVGTSDAVEKLISGGNTDLKKVVDKVNETAAVQVQYGSFGWVPKTNSDQGLAVAASSLKKGQVSGAITPTSGDGYYFVKLNDSNSTQVNFDYIFVPLSTFNKLLTELQEDEEKTRLYIDIPDITAAEQEE